jgi:hypothetical protein
MPVRLGELSAELYLGESLMLGRLGTGVVTHSPPGAPIIQNEGQENFLQGTDFFLYWTAPIEDGGLSIIEYRIYVDGELQPSQSYSLGEILFSNGRFEVVISEGGSELLGTSVTVSAVTAAGEGPQSNPDAVPQ